MSYDKIIIKIENEGSGSRMVLITDNHIKHIIQHLVYFYKPGMLRHIILHIKLYLLARKENIPIINLDDIINRK